MGAIPTGTAIEMPLEQSLYLHVSQANTIGFRFKNSYAFLWNMT
jgi:hypothetical protein